VAGAAVMSASLPTRWARAVAADRTQPPTAKLVALAALARFANSDGMTWCPIKQVMELTGCSRTSVKTALRSLRAGRWVVATAPARHHIAPHYELRIPESGGPISDPLPASKGAESGPQGVRYPPVGGPNPDP
jgi:hypothetical protein